MLKAVTVLLREYILPDKNINIKKSIKINQKLDVDCNTVIYLVNQLQIKVLKPIPKLGIDLLHLSKLIGCGNKILNNTVKDN